MGPASESQLKSYFLEKAAQCRRLAAELVGDPAGAALIKIAEEFERRAASYLTRERQTRRRRQSQDDTSNT
jgi:hypothetical protein